MSEQTSYSREDWIPVFSQFDDHDGLEYDGVFDSAQDLMESVSNEEVNIDDPAKRERALNERGGLDMMEEYPAGQIFYEEPETGAEVFLAYSPPRADNEIIDGHLSLSGKFNGPAVGQTWTEMVEENGTEYMTAPAGSEAGLGNTVCWLHIPENYDPNELEDTIDAVVEVARNVARLDEELEDTVEDFEYLDME